MQSILIHPPFFNDGFQIFLHICTSKSTASNSSPASVRFMTHFICYDVHIRKTVKPTEIVNQMR